MQMREKVGKSQNTVFFQRFVAPEGRKVGSLKRRVRSQLARWEMKKCTPLWREAHFQVKMYKTPLSDHFWRFRCRKSARRCGAKHISKSKCTKHHIFAPLLEVWMLKKWHGCGGKHISKSKCTKHTRSGPLLELQMSLRFTTLHYITLHYTTLHNTTTTTTQLHNYTPIHSTTLNYTTLHYIKLHYTTLHYTTFHYTTLHYTTLHSSTLQLQLHNYTTTLHYTPLH